MNNSPKLFIIILISGIISSSISSLTAQYIEAGGSGTFIICSNGNLIGSGNNFYGQMCNPEYLPGTVPPQFLVEGDFTMVSSGGPHTLLLRSDSTIWGSGSNSNGILGLGAEPTQVFEPMKIGDANNWVYIETFTSGGYGIRDDGTLWGWGATTDGHFGSSIFQSYVPIQFDLATDWAKVSANWSHVVGLKQDSTLWAWGNNASGQLSTGDVIPLYAPTKVTGEKRWLDVKAGGSYTMALDTEHKLYVTGYTNDTTFVLELTMIMPDDKWKAIAAGPNFSAAIRSDGTLWTWGANSKGELGIGSEEVLFRTPVQVGSDTDWQEISTGASHMLAMKENGDIYSWGDNSKSQLGRASCDGRTYCTSPEKLVIKCTESSTGIPDLATARQSAFYPNPSNGSITLHEAEKIQNISLMDLAGRNVVQIDNIQPVLDLSYLTKGTYIMMIVTESERKAEHLIIQ